jgi:hypothetical protein
VHALSCHRGRSCICCFLHYLASADCLPQRNSYAHVVAGNDVLANPLDRSVTQHDAKRVAVPLKCKAGAFVSMFVYVTICWIGCGLCKQTVWASTDGDTLEHVVTSTYPFLPQSASPSPSESAPPPPAGASAGSTSAVEALSPGTTAAIVLGCIVGVALITAAALAAGGYFTGSKAPVSPALAPV